MRGQEVRVFGESVEELDGPDVVGFGGLGGGRGRDLYPFGTPLSDGEAWVLLAADAWGGSGRRVPSKSSGSA